NPVVGRAVSETLQRFFVVGFLAIEFGATEKHLAQPEYDWGVGIAFAFDLSMVLAVNSHPFFGDHTCGQPHPETEEVHDCRMQVHPSVGFATVQEYRNSDNSNVRKHQGNQHDLPPGKL